ncbi:MAG: hypothetical protein ACP5O0_02410 [Acidimicrobiales bacterium]
MTSEFNQEAVSPWRLDRPLDLDSTLGRQRTSFPTFVAKIVFLACRYRR